MKRIMGADSRVMDDGSGNPFSAGWGQADAGLIFSFLNAGGSHNLRANK
jgi:hypothetical protein